MPSVLYAISYYSTASVVALCSLEPQEVPDGPAWSRLLRTLVGPRLPVSLSTRGGPLEIPANELGCDLVRAPSQQELEAVLAEPYKFRVSLEPDEAGPVRPGDGQEKVLRRANANAVQSIELIVGRAGLPQVRVTLASPAPAGVEARLLFEGGLAVRVPASGSAAVSPDLLFTLGSDVTITPGASYGMMFFMAGAPVEARSVRASDRSAEEARRAAAAAAAAAAAVPVAPNVPNAPNAPNAPNVPKAGS